MKPASELTLRSPHQVMAFDPLLGGRVSSWLVDGHEMITAGGDHPVEHGMYSMAPWAGRVRDNRIALPLEHGDDATEVLVHDLPVTYPPWALHGSCLAAPIDSWEQLSRSHLRMSQRIPGWPATLWTEWRLDDWTASSSLRVEAEERVPALMGWHPWFPATVAGRRAQWSLSGSIALRDGRFPSGQLQPWNQDQRVDDAFFVPDGMVEVRWGSLTLTIRNSGPWFVIYDERDDALCVEPQNGPPNAFENPIVGSAPTAGPGAPCTMDTVWSWTP